MIHPGKKEDLRVMWGMRPGSHPALICLNSHAWHAVTWSCLAKKDHYFFTFGLAGWFIQGRKRISGSCGGSRQLPGNSSVRIDANLSLTYAEAAGIHRCTWLGFGRILHGRDLVLLSLLAWRDDSSGKEDLMVMGGMWPLKGSKGYFRWYPKHPSQPRPFSSTGTPSSRLQWRQWRRVAPGAVLAKRWSGNLCRGRITIKP